MNDLEKKFPRPQEDETAYLLKSPKNAQRLLQAIAKLETGEGNERELLEESGN